MITLIDRKETELCKYGEANRMRRAEFRDTGNENLLPFLSPADTV